MKQNYFKIILAFMLLGILFIALSFFSNVECSMVLLIVGMLLSSISWGVVFYDIVKSKVYNKTFWILSMFFLPCIGAVFYLLQRDKLVYKGN